MTKPNLYVDINVLQTVPSSNINRDDTGAPKTALYGGVTRSRVSSQSWKRAVRLAFEKDSFSDNEQWLKGLRTVRGPQLLAKELQKFNSELNDDQAIEKSLAIFSAAKIKVDKKKYVTKALLMLSHGQIEQLAKYALENDDLDSKAVKKVLKDDNSLDMALFGRMVADDPSLNVDAACQVAHAISTHEVIPEFDYFTAVDDSKPEEEAGSAMLGTIEYDSSTLYRYANVNVIELMKNLGDKATTIEGLRLFIKDFIMSMPTGKQNTFANKTVPQYVMVTVREDTPVNLVSAFEDPVRSQHGYVQPSIDKFEQEYKKTQKFVERPLQTLVLTDRDSKMIDEQVENIQDLLTNVIKAVESRVKDEDSNN